MGFRLILLVSILLFCLAQVLSEAKIETQENQVVKGDHRRMMRYVDCGGLCEVRCSSHSRPNVCLRACGTCCRRCRCVPPGTSGNREKCGRLLH